MTTLSFPVPPASDSPTEHADWLEIHALKSSDGVSSINDIERELRRSSSVEGMGDFEDVEYQGEIDSSIIVGVVDDGFGEIEDRFKSCGGVEGVFPFAIQSNYLECIENPDKWVYVFLLLLSKFGKDAGPENIKATKLFEEICGEAAQAYLGGPDDLVGKKVFGFPRRDHTGFLNALESLLRELGEGESVRKRETIHQQKDATLDIVAWRAFWDKRKGKLIAFGQCATGNDWESKLTELQPKTFCEMWMNENPPILPIKMFFVPHRLELVKWFGYCSFGGIVFDRCRIAYYAKGLTEETLGQCQEWSMYVLDRVEGAD